MGRRSTNSPNSIARISRSQPACSAILLSAIRKAGLLRRGEMVETNSRNLG